LEKLKNALQIISEVSQISANYVRHANIIAVQFLLAFLSTFTFLPRFYQILPLSKRYFNAGSQRTNLLSDEGKWVWKYGEHELSMEADKLIRYVVDEHKK